MLMPYFAYVFDFLDPEKVVGRIEQQALRTGARRPGQVTSPRAETRQGSAVTSIEQLADIAVNAVSQKDKVDRLRRHRRHQGSAGQLPAARRRGYRPPWFTIGEALRDNPDFVSLAAESLDGPGARADLAGVEGAAPVSRRSTTRRSARCRTSTTSSPSTRATSARRRSRPRTSDALALAVKFFNTYLRATLNTRDVRTAYNVLNQYRQLAEAHLDAPATDRRVGCWRDRGLLQVLRADRARASISGFITETVAYDLATLCELLLRAGSPAHDGLLGACSSSTRKRRTRRRSTCCAACARHRPSWPLLSAAGPSSEPCAR